MQNFGMAPLFMSWKEALSTQRVGEDVCLWPAPKFGQKIGLNLSEDLFFWSSPNSGQENRTEFG